MPGFRSVSNNTIAFDYVWGSHVMQHIIIRIIIILHTCGVSLLLPSLLLLPISAKELGTIVNTGFRACAHTRTHTLPPTLTSTRSHACTCVCGHSVQLIIIVFQLPVSRRCIAQCVRPHRPTAGRVHTRVIV